MKKRDKYILAGILIFVLFFILNLMGKFNLFAVVLPSESYYDERCVDVSQYYDQGYTNSRIDEHGCQIVSKRLTASNVPTGYCITSGTWVAPPSGVKTMCAGIQDSSMTHFYSDRKDCWYCTIYTVDEKGGFERVLNYCSYEAGDILVGESFSGSRVITKDDLRYPIKSFCRAHPAIITDADGLTSFTSTNIPQDLIDGKSISIASGDTLTLFYTINNIYDLPDKCDHAQNLALDLSTGLTCKSTLGFTYLCSEGVWDAQTGSCTVVRTAECGIGERLVINSDGSKTCIYNPPLQVECPDGYTFDLNRDTCYRVPQSIDVCFAPYVLYEPSQTECLENDANWLLCPQCPTDKICSQSICKAQCDEGIMCIRTPEVFCNGTIVNGKCILLDESSFRICADNEEWSEDLKSCTVDSLKDEICPDGSQPINNICYDVPDGYIKCPETQVLSEGKCIDMAILSNAVEKASSLIWTYLLIFIILLLALFFIFKMKKK